jgi:hypothetical protein
MRRLIAVVAAASFVLACALGAGCAEAATDRKNDTAAGQPVAAEARDGAPGERKPDRAAPPRKIIYTGNVSLVVEDFDRAEARLLACVKEHGGYVARSEVVGEPG